MRRPLKMMRPALTGSAPETRLNSVVLPAPLGPMRPVMEPARTASEQWSTARRPPKSLTTPRTSKIAPASLIAVARRA